VRFTQENVHDFAWFADKRFEVLKGEVVLPHTGKKSNNMGNVVTPPSPAVGRCH